jgi:hypothetical protein
MKKLSYALILTTTSILFYGCPKDVTSTPVVGCMDQDASNYNARATQECDDCCKYKGSLLFWTNIPLACGAITIDLSNGQETTIVNYYITSPANCENLAGGYFYVDEGTYTYTVTTQGGCPIEGGTVVVKGQQCNFKKVI